MRRRPQPEFQVIIKKKRWPTLSLKDREPEATVAERPRDAATPSPIAQIIPPEEPPTAHEVPQDQANPVNLGLPEEQTDPQAEQVFGGPSPSLDFGHWDPLGDDLGELLAQAGGVSESPDGTLQDGGFAAEHSYPAGHAVENAAGPQPSAEAYPVTPTDSAAIADEPAVSSMTASDTALIVDEPAVSLTPTASEPASAPDEPVVSLTSTASVPDEPAVPPEPTASEPALIVDEPAAPPEPTASEPVLIMDEPTASPMPTTLDLAPVPDEPAVPPMPTASDLASVPAEQDHAKQVLSAATTQASLAEPLLRAAASPQSIEPVASVSDSKTIRPTDAAPAELSSRIPDAHQSAAEKPSANSGRRRSARPHRSTESSARERTAEDQRQKRNMPPRAPVRSPRTGGDRQISVSVAPALAHQPQQSAMAGDLPPAAQAPVSPMSTVSEINRLREMAQALQAERDGILRDLLAVRNQHAQRRRQILDATGKALSRLGVGCP